MTTDYKALVERINHILRVIYLTQQEQDALRTVVTMLEGMAEAKPALWMQSDHVSWAGKQPFMARCAPTQLQPDFVPLYTHPAPQPQPERQPKHSLVLQAAKACEVHDYSSRACELGTRGCIVVHKPTYIISHDGAVSTTADAVLNSEQGRAQLDAVRQMRERQPVSDDQVRKALAFCPLDLPHLDRVRWIASYLNGTEQPVSEPTNSELLRAAGYTRRFDRIECDECGKKFTPQFLSIHKCEAGSEARGEIERASLQDLLAVVRRERDEAQDKALRFDLDQAGIAHRESEAVELIELRAERDALRADAKRYRFLRDDTDWPQSDRFWEALQQGGEQIDAVIDAALAAKENNDADR